MLSSVNKRLDCVATGIVFFVVFPRGEDVSEDAKLLYRFFPVTRELRVILDTCGVVREIKHTPHVGAFPAKTSTCSCLFSARVKNEPQELPRYAASELT